MFPWRLISGVAVYPGDGDQKEALIHVADERLYKMKESQRNGAPAHGEEADLPRPQPEHEQEHGQEQEPDQEPPPGPSAPHPFAPGGQLPGSQVPGTVPGVHDFRWPAERARRRGAATPPLREFPPPRPVIPEKRKWERVPLAGTRAYAQFAEVPQRTIRVLDLSYGGVAFEIGTTEELAATFYAVLHVPILPPVRVSLKKLYQIRLAGGQLRVGCSFVT